MRRILRKIATKDEKELGDLSTLADPEVVKALIGGCPLSSSKPSSLRLSTQELDIGSEFVVAGAVAILPLIAASLPEALQSHGQH